MTTEATAIREAIFSRLYTLPGYRTVKRVFTPQLQPRDLPSLSIGIVSEDLMPDGDANASEPHFVSHTVIGISVLRGFDDPAVLDGQIDTDIDSIESMLLTDPSFVAPGTTYHVPEGVGHEAPLFECVTRIRRQREYPFQGETYFCELRLEITFENRVRFIPYTPDAFKVLRMEAHPFGHSDAPHVIIRYDIPQ